MQRHAAQCMRARSMRPACNVGAAVCAPLSHTRAPPLSTPLPAPRHAEAKNKSSIALADEQIPAATSYQTTSALEFGPKELLVKTPYPKNPLPDFIHFGADSSHPSMYNGYHAQ